MTLDPFLLIGLGTPGREYANTRHNFGFMLIDRIAVRLNARGMKVQSKAIVTTANYEERKLILAKPQTFMNLSGQSVQGLVHFYKIPLTNVMILSDDLDIPFGTIRIRAAGGPGGQRGLPRHAAKNEQLRVGRGNRWKAVERGRRWTGGHVPYSRPTCKKCWVTPLHGGQRGRGRTGHGERRRRAAQREAGRRVHKQDPDDDGASGREGAGRHEGLHLPDRLVRPGFHLLDPRLRMDVYETRGVAA